MYFVHDSVCLCVCVCALLCVSRCTQLCVYECVYRENQKTSSVTICGASNLNFRQGFSILELQVLTMMLFFFWMLGFKLMSSCLHCNPFSEKDIFQIWQLLLKFYLCKTDAHDASGVAL